MGAVCSTSPSAASPLVPLRLSAGLIAAVQGSKEDGPFPTPDMINRGMHALETLSMSESVMLHNRLYQVVLEPSCTTHCVSAVEVLSHGLKLRSGSDLSWKAAHLLITCILLRVDGGSGHKPPLGWWKEIEIPARYPLELSREPLACNVVVHPVFENGPPPGCVIVALDGKVKQNTVWWWWWRR